MLWSIWTMSIRQTRAKDQHNLRSVNFDEHLETNNPANPPCWEHVQHLVWQQLCQCICICCGTHICREVLHVYGLVEYWDAKNLRLGWELQWWLGPEPVLQRSTQLVTEAGGGGSLESIVLSMNFHGHWEQPRAHPEPSERLCDLAVLRS